MDLYVANDRENKRVQFLLGKESVDMEYSEVEKLIEYLKEITNEA